jgi:hypothetical protein
MRIKNNPRVFLSEDRRNPCINAGAKYNGETTTKYNDLQDEGVLVMVDLRAAIAVEDYCDDIETVRTVFNIVGFQKVLCGVGHFLLFVGCYKCFGGGEVFICATFYFDKNNSAAVINHNEVDFAGFAGEILCEGM